MTTKKLSVLAFIGLGIMSYGQEYDGKIGVNTTEPKATLDLNIATANTSTPEGLLIPRVSRTRVNVMTASPNNATSVKKSTLIYVDNIDGSTNEQTVSIDAEGFYYYDGAKWVKLGAGGSSVAADNGLSLNGTAIELGGTLTKNTSIAQGAGSQAFDLIFNALFPLDVNGEATKSGKFGVNGRFIAGGAAYLTVEGKNPNYRKVSLQTEIAPLKLKETDYFLNITISGPQNIVLPNPADHVGRLIYIRNNSIEAGSAGTYTYITYVPVNNTSILPNRGQLLFSDGNKWYVMSGL